MKELTNSIMTSLVYLVCGTAASIAAGCLLWGSRAFGLTYVDFPFLSIGIAGSLVYVISERWGWWRALVAAWVLATAITMIAHRLFWTVWPQSFEMLALIILLNHLLTVWKITRPAFGRLLLLGPLFAVILGLTMFLFRLSYSSPYMYEASMNTAGHYLVLGLGLGFGLEIARLITGGWRRVHSLATSPQ